MATIASALRALLASLRYVVAIELGILLLWSLSEITYGVYRNPEYYPLALLCFTGLSATLGITVWIWARPRDFGLPEDAGNRLNALPLALLDTAVLGGAVIVSDQLREPLTTPLLHLTQTLLHKLTG